MNSHIIALCGYASVGKDTVADLLVTHLKFRKLAFADALRGEVANAFGVDLSCLTDPSTKNEPMGALALATAPIEFRNAMVYEWAQGRMFHDSTTPTALITAPRSPRQILQWWGTEYRRKQNDAYWTRQLTARINAYQHDGGTRFVITDCRFDNEAATVRALDGQIWQIKRPGIDHGTTRENGHVSANDGSAFAPDVVINNAHDVRHLQHLVLAEFIAREAGCAPGSVKVTVLA